MKKVIVHFKNKKKEIIENAVSIISKDNRIGVKQRTGELSFVYHLYNYDTVALMEVINSESYGDELEVQLSEKPQESLDDVFKDLCRLFRM